MPQANPQPTTQINIELPADLEAIYTNFAIITHSASEILIDCARMLPGAPKAKVQTRLVMTPLNAKLLLRALEDNLAKYEARFGEVRVPAETGFEAQDRTIGFKH
ncbi:MAG: hypothetical protein BWY52_00403 [Chloroflexi bacterium ADurb.Bin325]|nr:MAG: hypothetical protein BWY52_00403 [Chloroflexi bacterium ADurb.Bin325]